ncbi:hypothetical protein EDC04DRAFT_750837 [Pisolithus marmoratus]|nr:hypothetical protein EDC04DRAFT_750837 [Pisolithus marmoratus]
MILGGEKLTPAPQNPFTAIWVLPIDNPQDHVILVDSSWRHEKLRPSTTPFLVFCHWLHVQLDGNSVCMLQDIVLVNARSHYLSGRASVLLGLGRILSSPVFTHTVGRCHTHERDLRRSPDHSQILYRCRLGFGQVLRHKQLLHYGMTNYRTTVCHLFPRLLPPFLLHIGDELKMVLVIIVCMNGFFTRITSFHNIFVHLFGLSSR